MGRSRKIFAIILSIQLVFTNVIPANAGLEDKMNSLFNEWGFRVSVNEPRAFEAQSRGFIVGGSMTARIKNDYVQPFNLKLPSIKAGCGGIDIFGGAFSFINADQLVALLQKIGQQALGYAFSLGLEAVCPTCNSVIKWLRNTMNSLNQLGFNSCTAAKALVNSLGETMGMWELESCKANKGQDSLSDKIDFIKGWLECTAGNESNIRQQLRSRGQQRTSDAINNKEKQAMTRGASTAEALRWSDLSEDERIIVMSVIGTWATGYDPNSNEDYVCRWYAPTLSLDDLVQGGEVTLLTCGNGGLADNSICENIQRTTTTIEGFAKKAEKQMKEIVTKLENSEPLTADQKKFVNSVPVPAIKYMLHTAVRYDPLLAEVLANITAEVVGVMLGWHLIEEYLKVFEDGTGKISVCNLDNTKVLEQVRKVKEERHQLFDKYMKVFNAQLVSLQYISALDAKIGANVSRSLFAAMHAKF